IGLGGAQPDWSPNGRALVLTDGQSISLQPLRRDARVAVVVRGTSLARPRWSPNGRWIAYVGSTKAPSETGLWLVRPNGKARHRVARDAPSTFAWSPDSRSLAYG